MMEVNLEKSICIIHNILWKLLLHEVETGKNNLPIHLHALLCFSTPQHTYRFSKIYYQGNHELANKAKLGYICAFNIKEIGLSNDSYLMVTRTLYHDHNKSSTTQYSLEIDLSYCSNVEKAQEISINRTSLYWLL